GNLGGFNQHFPGRVATGCRFHPPATEMQQLSLPASHIKPADAIERDRVPAGKFLESLPLTPVEKIRAAREYSANRIIKKVLVVLSVSIKFWLILGNTH
ncbi:MAG: hypothetical protein ACK6DZ_09530, partial [Acidobacteriota bacterium]